MQLFSGERYILPCLIVVKAMQWSLMSICSYVLWVKITPGRILLAAINLVLAGIISKDLCPVWIQSRQQTTLCIFVIHYRKLRTEKKWVFACWMPVQINQKQKFIFVLAFQLMDIVPQTDNLRKNKLCVFREFSVQIFTCKTCPCVADNHSIRVHHGHNLENDTK